MTQDTAAIDAGPVTSAGNGPPTAKRINVALNAAMMQAIDRVIEREQVTLTEAVRRLLTYGEYIYSAVKEDKAAVVVRSPEGDEKELVLV